MTLLRFSNRSKLAKQIDEGWYDWMSAEERESIGFPSRPTSTSIPGIWVYVRALALVGGPLVLLPPAIASGVQAGGHMAATTAAFVASAKAGLVFVGLFAGYMLCIQWLVFNKWHWRPEGWAAAPLTLLGFCVSMWVGVGWLPELFIENWPS